MWAIRNSLFVLRRSSAQLPQSSDAVFIGGDEGLDLVVGGGYVPVSVFECRHDVRREASVLATGGVTGPRTGGDGQIG